MTNREITNKALKADQFKYYGWTTTGESDVEVQILPSKAVFLRYSVLFELKKEIETYGGGVKDLYVSTMPAMNNSLCIVVEFNEQ